MLLTASAASPSVAGLLQQTFAAAAGGQPTALVVQDLAPLPSSDPRGATSFSAVLSLLFAGLLGPGIIYLVTQHRPLTIRLVALVGLGIGAGLVTALTTNVIVGAFPSHFFGVWGVATLFVVAMCLAVAAFQVLFGLGGGAAIGWVLFLVIGNPASGGSSAPELLPGFWRAVSQLLPPGAATTAMHNVVYFHGYGAAMALVVLGIYAILGAAAAITINALRAHAQVSATTALLSG